MKPATFPETLQRVKRERTQGEYALLYPHLIKLPLPYPKDLYCIDNIELALLCLDDDTWLKVEAERIVTRDDDTFRTGDPFFDELEEMISSGSNIDAVLAKL